MTKETQKHIKSLLKKISTGNKKAYETFHESYYAYFKNFVSGIVKDENVAEDITQEMFLKILTLDFRGLFINNVSAYLFGIAKNLCNDYFRKNNLIKKYITGIKATNGNIQIYDFEGLNFDDIFEGLTDIEQQLVTLRYISGYSVKYISERLDISKRVLSRKYTEIKEKIRKNIQKNKL